VVNRAGNSVPSQDGFLIDPPAISKDFMITWGRDVKITVVKSGEGAGATDGAGEFRSVNLISSAGGLATCFVLGVLGLYHSVCHFMTEIARRF